MSHKIYLHSGPAVKRLLERKDHRHPVHVPLQSADPPRSPGPDLRAYVVKYPEAFLPGRLRQREVEIGIVDQNHEARLFFAQQAFQAEEIFHDELQPGRNFRQSDHRHIGGVGQDPHPRPGHPPAAYSLELQPRIYPPHLPHEIGSVQVAGCLSGDDQDAPCAAV